MQDEAVGAAFGCFYFQLTEAAPAEFTTDDYLKWVREALGEIASVGDIRVETPPGFSSSTYTKPDDLDRRTELQQDIPFIQFLRIRFTVHVPKRFQDELGLMLDPNIGEDFKVYIDRGWAKGLAMVVATDASTADQTDGVIAVREFLTREFDRIGERPIKFQCLGPSPAHLKVTLKEDDSGEGDFRRLSHERRGYDFYSFGTGRTFDTSEELCVAFFRRIANELDLLYRMQAAQIRQGDLWSAVSEDVSGVLEAFKRTGLRGTFGRIWHGRKLRRVLIALGEAELQQQRDKQRFDQAIRSTYEIGRGGLIREVIVDDLEDLEPQPIAPLSSLLQLIDSSRHTRSDVLVASIASLMGAAVAAAATLIAAG